jgi:hypothetical protein
MDQEMVIVAFTAILLVILVALYLWITEPLTNDTEDEV